MFLTGLSADLHSTWRYSTSASRGSGAATTSMVEQTFAYRQALGAGELDVGARRLADGPPLPEPSPGANQRRRAEIVEHALFAARTARVADPAAVQEQAQRQRRPLLFQHRR